MTWEELLQTNYKTIIVQSYGYVEKSAFSSHFEPFRHLREFVFNVEILEDVESGEIIESWLSHKWLFLGEPESELSFEERDGKVYCFDPDLWAKME